VRHRPICITNPHCYTGTVFFWVKTIALYVVTAIFAFLLSLAVSFCAVWAWAGSYDDSPALGILWILLLVVMFGLFLPLCLGLTAELLQGRNIARRFSWLRGMLRAVVALPISVGPVYAWWVLLMRREDARPSHWLVNLVLLLAVSALSAFLALRVSRPQCPLRPPPTPSPDKIKPWQAPPS
jgi:MFS family permease